ncbi:hypothetical protein PAHAL_9G120200 [Panicum hallii]|uniref:Uncharacterized protein n=1 Tax=Panicum hallii TaxID=206008 RepID=A0A2S3IIX5_9POAL|nr:hypothetical protein PAHAL_9G120200 [Panicum hallii]
MSSTLSQVRGPWPPFPFRRRRHTGSHFLPPPATDWTPSQSCKQKACRPLLSSFALAAPHPFHLASCALLVLCRAPPLQRGHRPTANPPPPLSPSPSTRRSSSQDSSPNGSRRARPPQRPPPALLDEMPSATPSRGSRNSWRPRRAGYPPNKLALPVSALSPCLFGVRRWWR